VVRIGAGVVGTEIVGTEVAGTVVALCTVAGFGTGSELVQAGSLASEYMYKS
jgi:hypothetical protein